MTVVLGLDTGFANTGYSVVHMSKKDLKLIRMGVVTTKKSNKKLNVKSADDNFERARQISFALNSLCEEFDPKLVCAEAISFVRSSQTMLKVGMCFGIIADLVTARDLPFIQVTPQQIKKELTGTNSAAKEVIQAALDKKFQNAPKKYLDKLKLAKTKREHPYDSLGAIVASWDSDPMRIARSML